MPYTIPTIAEFKTYFDRDFPYGLDTDPKKVRDKDIQQALDQTPIAFADGLMVSQSMFTICYMLLTAHFLCENIRSAASGAYGQFSWLQQSKSAGDVSESFAIPQKILNSPFLSALATTKYGARYLAFISPYLIGNVDLAFGDSTI